MMHFAFGTLDRNNSHPDGSCFEMDLLDTFVPVVIGERYWSFQHDLRLRCVSLQQ